MKPRSDQPGVAIVGMSCRFPGAPDCASYWGNLIAGVESIARITDKELLDAGVLPEMLSDPDYVKAAPVLDNVEYFDAPFFEYSPGEARLTDPQQRLLLEVAWEAFEDAGYPPGGVTGVFVGCGGIASSYLLDRIGVSSDLRGYTGSLPHLGNDKDFASTRISYKLNLTGPSINIQTACSTSLVAVHLACQSILSGECDMALAGASAVRVPQKAGYHSVKGGILSRDGHCRAFDADATGTIFGSGVGVVLLKDLTRALDDRDRIYAVIRGSAINNDGADKVSYTASSVPGQANAMVEALAVAQVDAAEIGYVECHGTGTAVGDPLELGALSRAFRIATEERQFCAIGSVKSNFGHLEQCAGMAGLIKAALALYHGKIPPSLHFCKPNPKFDFSSSAFFVNTECRDWPAKDGRRFAAVNSLGLGGTNAFAVLEQAPAVTSCDAPAPRPHLIVLSAKTADALNSSISRHAAFLDDKAGISLADISRTLTEGRQHFSERFATVAATLPGLRDRLVNAAAASPHVPNEAHPKLAFLFSGQASQYSGMGEELYRNEPRFRETFDRCGELFKAARGHKLTDVVFEARNRSQLDQTCNTQPALYAVQCSLVNLWRSWGVVPDFVLGHSVGEFAAAFCAGAYTLEDGLALVLGRSDLMQSLQPGSMAAIAADQPCVTAAMADLECEDLSIAALNAPQSTVISGPEKTVMRLLAVLGERGVAGQKLSVSHAFHSPLMLPAMAAFREAVSHISIAPPKLDWISTLTGRPMSDAPSADYWVDHALKPVRFSDAMLALAERDVTQYVEIGPGDALLALGRQCAAETRSTWLASLRRNKECQSILESAGELYRQGRNFDWNAFNAGAGGRRMSLPTYPFERHRYWLDGRPGHKPKAVSASLTHSLSGARLSTASDDIIHEATYCLRDFPYLRDHCIYGEPVLPFAAGLVAFWESGRGHLASGRAYLSNVQYHKAIILPDDPERPVQLIFASTESGGLNFRLSSRDGEIWQSHMAGQVRHDERESPKVAIRKSVDAIRARCPAEVGIDDYYTSLRMLGLEYGPAFRGIAKIYRGADEILTRVNLSVDLPLPDAGQHPALLDACLHIYPALADEFPEAGAVSEVRSAYLPVGIERFGLSAIPRRDVWVHARRREQDVAQRTMTVDLDVFDDDGATVATMTGLLLKMLSPAALTGDRPIDVKDWIYRVEWKPVEDEAFPDGSGTPRSSWLILADGEDVANELAGRLTRRGDVCRLLHARDLGASTQSNAVIDDMFSVLLDAVDTMSRPDEPPLRGIIDLRPSDTNRQIRKTSDVDLLQRWIVGGAAAVFRALAHAPMHRSATARVWLVTRNAVAAAGEGRPINPMMATIWGLGRSAALEHPNAWGGLIDLDADTSARVSADILFQQILNGAREDQIAVRSGKCFGGRLVRMPAPDASAQFDTDAHYLITGGLGAVGSELARWLVARHGVKHLVLVSRRGSKDTHAPSLCDELKALGADVMVSQADVTDERELKAVLAELDRKRAKLKGVFHCAGLLDDGILAQMDWPKFSRVMMPKITGAWLLDKLTRSHPLDHFVMFSSVLSVMGSAGQANYAAANTFLDSLVARRRQDGLAALALNWGPWAAEGLATASGDKGRALWRARGTRYIESREAWAAFDALIGKCQGQAAITITDWPVFLRQFEKVPRLYERLRRESPITARAPQAVPDAIELRNRLATASALERRELLADFIGKAVTSTLGIAGSIDPNRSLQQYGLDSLMSITLINRLETALGTRIPMAKLIRGPSLDELVDGIMAENNEAFVDSKTQGSARAQADNGSWLTVVGPRTNPSCRLFCFPFAGGGSAVYRTWVPSIRGSIEVVAIEPPGRLNRIAENPVSDIDEFVDRVTADLGDKLDRPFAFFGHCLGGLTMYETARRLVQTTPYRPSHLFVSGARPPDRLADQGAFERQLLRDLVGLAEFRINLPSHAQPDDVFAEIIRRFNILATEQLLEEPELRELMLPVVRAEFRMANNYIFKPETGWDIPITCFYAQGDPYVTRDHALGWGRFTNSRLQAYVRSGAHFAVVDDMEFITGVINRELQI